VKTTTKIRKQYKKTGTEMVGGYELQTRICVFKGHRYTVP